MISAGRRIGSCHPTVCITSPQPVATRNAALCEGLLPPACGPTRVRVSPAAGRGELRRDRGTDHSEKSRTAPSA